MYVNWTKPRMIYACLLVSVWALSACEDGAAQNRPGKFSEVPYWQQAEQTAFYGHGR
jgi:hypothetical protein